VAAGDPHDGKIRPPESSDDLCGLKSRQATHTPAVIFALSCSKMGSASPSSCRVFASR
jgi:hypothetical protein